MNTVRSSRLLAMYGRRPFVNTVLVSSSHTLLPPHSSLYHKQNIAFISSSLKDWWGIPRYQYTKYRITKPWSENTQFDDIFMSQPSKDDFAKFTKDIPLFLRFLKLVTDLEGRPQTFIDFTKRCSQGLIVEKDVYITKKELMEMIWKNGYSESEMNAFEIAFTSDYLFHYPELAVLFDISEEDCYKFCVHKRAENPTELVELNYKPPQNLVSTYGLVFVAVWMGLSNNVLGNAWFLSKTIPFGAVFWLLATYFYKDMKNYFWTEESALLDTARQNKAVGEEAVYSQMKKYSNDSRCLEFLSSFKDDIQKQLAQYHSALANKQKTEMSNRLNQKLIAIQQAENNMQNSLQKTIVSEIVNSFKEKFQTDQTLQEASFLSAINMISQEQTETTSDPLQDYFSSAFKQIQQNDFSKPETAQSSNKTVAQIAKIFQQNEKEFLDAFTVKQDEATQVQSLVNKCSTNGVDFDFTKLTPDEYNQLESLYTSINNKVGFEIPHENQFLQLETPDEASSEYIDYVNSKIKEITAAMKQQRLTAFAQGFA